LRSGKILVAIVCLAYAGCGGPTKVSPVPAKGTVKSAGSLAGSQIVLSPVKSDAENDHRTEASGVIGSDGSFTLTSYESGDGAAPGKYTVFITKASGGMDAMMSKEDPLKDLPAKFRNPVDSPLTVEIKDDGPNDLTIDLTPS
jgi:hypothetical protein